MNPVYTTLEETKQLANSQLYSIDTGINNGHFTLQQVGELIPGAVIVQNLETLQVDYLNGWGCDTLRHPFEEVKAMGPAYYQKFFNEDELKQILPDTIAFCNRQDTTAMHSFFQQVRTGPGMPYNWYYTICKFYRTDAATNTKMIFVSNPVSGMGHMVNKVNKVLDENVYVANNYKKFAALTKREKEIISLLAEGKSTNDISNLLFISHHTVSTHRKNITNKLQIHSFSGLLKFAAAFELIK